MKQRLLNEINEIKYLFTYNKGKVISEQIKNDEFYLLNLSALKSDYKSLVNKDFYIIQTLIALCPVLGLLGTVTGMIEVFDVVSFFGTGNARALASGITKATLPTMAGMTTALSGVFATIYLTSARNREENSIKEIIKS